MRGVGNVETLQQNGGIAFRGVSVFLADNAFKFAQPHAVFIGHLGLCVNLVALFHGGPQALVAHDDGIDHAIGVKGKLVLAEYAELFGAHNAALLRLKFAGKQVHKGRLAGAVRASEAKAFARRERGADLFKQNFCAIAHGNVTN